MGSQSQKIQKSQKVFLHTLSCRDFYADHFAKKLFFISSINDTTRVKIQKRWIATMMRPFSVF
jgi:hypothetical protein